MKSHVSTSAEDVESSFFWHYEPGMFEEMGNGVTPDASLCLQNQWLWSAVTASEQPRKGIQGRVQDPFPLLLSFNSRNIQQMV